MPPSPDPTVANQAFIEQCLGPVWPKTLYPHGAGREWSTEMRDQWKADQGFDVVAHEHLRATFAALNHLYEAGLRLAVLTGTMDEPDYFGWEIAMDAAREVIRTAVPSPSSDQTKEDR